MQIIKSTRNNKWITINTTDLIPINKDDEDISSDEELLESYSEYSESLLSSGDIPEDDLAALAALTDLADAIPDVEQLEQIDTLIPIAASNI